MVKYDCNSSEFIKSLEELSNSGSTIPLYVSGNSMNPFLIGRRDIVWLEAVKIDELKSGNIVLFRRIDGSLVLHRIRRVLPSNKLQVMGDAQVWSEEIYASSVIAVVTAIQRKEKKRSAESPYWKTINLIWKIFLPLRSLIMRIWFKFKR